MSTATTEWVYEVEGPDFENEETVPYYEEAAEVFESIFGRKPSRNGLMAYLHSRPGYPIKRGGPYVAMPVRTRLKRVWTTKEAMRRWAEAVRELEEIEGVQDATSYTPKRSRLAR